MLTPIKTSFEKSRFWLKNRKLCGRRSLEFSSARRVKWWNIISVSLMQICYIEMTTVLYSLFRCPRPINRVVRLTRVSRVSILMIARLFRLLCPIVLRRYVFSLRSPLKERSAEHDVAGITARIDTTFEKSELLIFIQNFSYSFI